MYCFTQTFHLTTSVRSIPLSARCKFEHYSKYQELVSLTVSCFNFDFLLSSKFLYHRRPIKNIARVCNYTAFPGVGVVLHGPTFAGSIQHKVAQNTALRQIYTRIKFYAFIAFVHAPVAYNFGLGCSPFQICNIL